MGTLTMFWVKTAFRVGWDTGFQPLGWATTSTSTLFLWRERERESKMVQKERDRQAPAKTGIIDSTKQWGIVNKNSLNSLQTVTKAWFSSVSALKTCRRREAMSWRRGVLLLTQTEKNAWTVFLCSCDWIHFCGLDFVLRSYFRSLHVSCVVCWDKLRVCSLSSSSELIKQNTSYCFA